jgi:hypothetical protein
MNSGDLRSALANQQAMLDSNLASLASVKAQRERNASDIERLRRGDDLRAILLEGAEARLATLDAIVAQTEEQVRLMKESVRQLRNMVEG